MRAARIAKPLIFVAALVPASYLAWALLRAPEHLGVNPAETLQLETGIWTLRFLLGTLAVTPLRRLTGWHPIIQFRRMLGLFAFFYAVTHLTSYAGFDRLFNVDEILKDIAKRPFITVGFTALLLLIPLAITSTNAMVRRLGARRWLALHRLVYLIAPLGVLHFWWMVKRDVTQPAIYAAILIVLLGYRAIARLKLRQRAIVPGPNAAIRLTRT